MRQPKRAHTGDGDGFPFPLSGTAAEPAALTWLRNHSNYMAQGGLVDYARIVAVLLRGVSINFLVLLPLLLLMGLVLGLSHGGLIGEWDEQAAQAKTGTAETQAARVDEGTASSAATEPLVTAVGEADDGPADPATTAARACPPAAPGAAACISVTVPDGWLHDALAWYQPMRPYIWTPVAVGIGLFWVVMFPVLVLLFRVAGHNRSVATGSDSSVALRDLYERSFGLVLLIVLAVALFETVPLLVHYYRQITDAARTGERSWQAFMSAIAVILGGISGAPKLLSGLSGLYRTIGLLLIAALGLVVPLLVVMMVTEFLVFTDMSLETDWLILAVILLVVPVGFALGVAVTIAFGAFNRTFSVWEVIGLIGLMAKLLIAHVVLFVLVVVVYFGLGFLVVNYQWVVPEILLSVGFAEHVKTGTLTVVNYGDLAAYIVLGCALEIWLYCRLTVDINLTSIHGLYRDRLASAYLIRRNADATDNISIDNDIPLNELSDVRSGSIAPYHLINVALNLQNSTDIGLRDRKSDFFIFSKLYVGGERTGFCRTETLRHVFPQVDLASAMAISAAAASPNMGRGTSPALVASMTLLNIRLGVWIPNPGLIEQDLIAPRTRWWRRRESHPARAGLDFDTVFADELASVERRWHRLGARGAGRAVETACAGRPSALHGLTGVGFSGGGIRSATFNLGIAQALHEAGIFVHFDYMSTVSGGGYLGSSISALMRFGPGREAAGGAAAAAEGLAGGKSDAGTDRSAAAATSFGRRLRWRIPPSALLREMSMRLNERWKWVNLSDGGHIENMASMELLRRRCRLIVVGDGEEDVKMHFNGLATLIRTARIDLGIHIEIGLDNLRPDDNGYVKAHFAVGKIEYPRDDLTERDDETGYLLYLKSSCTGEEDEVIREYRSRNPAFPHESTADQFFDEGQFEAYRSLGQHIGEAAVRALGCPASGTISHAQLLDRVTRFYEGDGRH